MSVILLSIKTVFLFLEEHNVSYDHVIRLCVFYSPGGTGTSVDTMTMSTQQSK